MISSGLDRWANFSIEILFFTEGEVFASLVFARLECLPQADPIEYLHIGDKPIAASLAHRIMERAQELPEATPLGPATRETFANLGSAKEVEQALERLTEAEKLTRVFQGIYMRLIETRFGLRSPHKSEAIKELAQLWGETIVPCPGATANYLGLTTQNPVRRVYITSGPSRRLYFSRSMVELRHAPSWQLVAPERKAGAVIRALEWLGPQQEDVEDGLAAVLPILSKADQEELAAIASQHGTAMPPWLVKPLCDRFVAAGLE